MRIEALEAALEAERAKVKALRGTLGFIQEGAEAIVLRLSPATQGHNIDETTAERAYCDADEIVCAARQALARGEKAGDK